VVGVNDVPPAAVGPAGVAVGSVEKLAVRVGRRWGMGLCFARK
jgi:hypothetical protein